MNEKTQSFTTYYVQIFLYGCSGCLTFTLVTYAFKLGFPHLPFVIRDSIGGTHFTPNLTNLANPTWCERFHHRTFVDHTWSVPSRLKLVLSSSISGIRNSEREMLLVPASRYRSVIRRIGFRAFFPLRNWISTRCKAAFLPLLTEVREFFLLYMYICEQAVEFYVQD